MATRPAPAATEKQIRKRVDVTRNTEPIELTAQLRVDSEVCSHFLIRFRNSLLIAFSSRP